MSNLRTKLIRLAHEKPELRSHLLPLVMLDAPTRKASLKVPSEVHALAKTFMDIYGLKGTAKVEFTPTALTFIFPNWTGTAKDLETAILDRPILDWRNFQEHLSETIDAEEYVMHHSVKLKFSVRGTDAVVMFPMRPYDPDEDGPP